jgi:D-alanyl-D-alanine carboxypeptidase
VGEGRLSLQDTVGDLLPGVIRPVRPITVRQLLNHSSGLVGDSIGPPAPGTRFFYSNANYVLLGQIVEEVTGRLLERVVLDRIFRPLDLEDTSYGTAAVGSPDEGSWLGYPVVRYPASGPIRGNAGIISTVDDVATFFAALLSGQLLRPDLMEDMTHTIEGEEGVRAGLGIFRVELSCGVAWGHAGDGDFCSTASLAARDGSKVVVVAQNLSGWEAAISVAEDIYCS